MNIISTIEHLEQQHHNSIPVLGGARFAIEHTDNMHEFVSYFPTVISNAKFYHYDETPANALRMFCNLCLVYPMLVEVYLGMTFEELAQ